MGAEVQYLKEVMVSIYSNRMVEQDLKPLLSHLLNVVAVSTFLQLSIPDNNYYFVDTPLLH